MKRLVDVYDGKFAVSFSARNSGDFQDMVAEIKSLPNRYWNPRRREWIVEVTEESVTAFRRLWFEFTEEAEKLVQYFTSSVETSRSSSAHLNKSNRPKAVKEPPTRFTVEEAAKAAKGVAQAAIYNPNRKDPTEYTNMLARPTFIEMEMPQAPVDESKLEGVRPYQITGVRFLEAVGGRGIVGDEMGLGKTVEVIAYYNLHRALRPIIVVCPASAKYVWQRHILDWAGESVIVISGQKQYAIPKAMWYVINYEILGTTIPNWKEVARSKRYIKNPRLKPAYICGWVDELQKFKPAAVICDEGHYLSNETTIRTNAVLRLLRDADMREKGPVTIVTGTPLRAKVRDFFTSLNIVSPLMFPKRYGPGGFYERYCGPKKVYVGRSRPIVTYDGATHSDELHARLTPFMIRRLKADVLEDLPPKIRCAVPLELDPTEAKRYEKANADFLEQVRSRKRSLDDEQSYQALLHQAYTAKREQVINWITDYLDNGSKLVVFVWHLRVLDDLEQAFSEGSVRLDGSVVAEKRAEIVDRFQMDDTVRLFIGQMRAAGEAITLTAAPATAFVEFGQTASQHFQAEDRVHRISQQTKDAVIAYYLIGQGTIEGESLIHIEESARVLAEVLDGEVDVDFFDDSPLASRVIKSIRESK